MIKTHFRKHLKIDRSLGKHFLKKKKNREIMDLTRIEEAVRDSKGGIAEKKEVVAATLASPDENNVRSSIDSGRALQLFLDHVLISSIPDFVTANSCSELEVKTTDTVGYAIKLLYDKDLYFAPVVVDKFDTNFDKPKYTQQEFIGLIGLGSMILWFLQEEEEHSQAYCYGDEDFFSMLERNPPIAQTKVGELAKFFLWDPFFPIHMDDTLFHVLLLFSKHQLQAVPLTEKSNSVVSGFVSQSAVIRALLESSGLEWFDSIADRELSKFRFDSTNAVQIHGDQNMVEAIQVLWESKHGIVAVVDRDTERLIGSLRRSDLYLVLQDEDLYSDRKNLKVDQFIQLDAKMGESNFTTEDTISGRPSSSVGPAAAMVSPVTCRKTDSLKKVMKQLADTGSNFCFLIDECCNRVEGLITSNEIMVQFAPPCMDSRIGGGGFFISALEQAGCHINGETMVCNQCP